MSNQAKVLGKFTIKHDFFSLTSPAEKIILPSPLGYPDIKIRQTPQKTIIYSTSPNVSQIAEPLIFPLTLSDPNFFNYTNVEPPKIGQEILLLDSRQAVGGILKVEQAASVRLFPMRFLFPVEKDALSNIETVSIICMGKSLENLPKPTYSPKPGGYLIDLSTAPSGIYQITFTFLDKTTQTERFFASNELFQRPSPFVLYWLPANSNDSVTDLSLSFSSRLTYWRYFLCNLPEEDWQKTSISAVRFGDENIRFVQEKAPVELENGTKTCVFLSHRPLPLKESPSFKPEVSTPKLPISITLPYPSVNNIKKIEPPLVDQSGFSSEIFVYF